MINFQLQYECLCRFSFEPLGLRCKMTVMPLEWVLGHDKISLQLERIFGMTETMRFIGRFFLKLLLLLLFKIFFYWFPVLPIWRGVACIKNRIWRFNKGHGFLEGEISDHTPLRDDCRGLRQRHHHFEKTRSTRTKGKLGREGRTKRVFWGMATLGPLFFLIAV